MTNAIRIDAVGPPDVLKWQSTDVPDPGPNEVRLRQTAAGVNFIDIYQRSGLYPLAELPSGIGSEAAGVVEAVGSDVQDFRPGDRVAYAGGPVGAYAQARVISADHLVHLPDAISDQAAAAMMLKGMTVQFLLRQTFRVEPGMTVLFHAAAGGVGLIACQWLKHLGATMIGTVGSPEKAELARAHGCHHTIDYTREDVAERVRDLTDGTGVPVVYDSVGATTRDASLDSLAMRGTLVSFGNASGPPEPFPSARLAKASLCVTRPVLFHYIAGRTALDACANDLFDVVTSGAVSVDPRHTYAMADAAQAHTDLAGRKTTGAIVLVP